MNLRQLNYFVRIVETGNITRAAEQLYVAQPALGMQIRQLELELGVGLLTRHSRGVSPTKAGRILYERACEILRQVDEAEREVVAAGRQEREGVVLGLTTGVMGLIGRELVVRTRAELPGINLGLLEEMSSRLMDALDREKVDLALAYDVHQRPGLLRVPLLEEELLFVCASAAAPLHDPVQFADIVGLSLALPGSGDVVRRQLLDTAKRLALEPNVVPDVSSISALRSLIVHGDMASIMPYGTIIDALERGQVASRRIANPPLIRTLYFVRSLRRAPIKNEDALLDLLGALVIQFLGKLGSLGAKLPALDRPLSETVASFDMRHDGAEQVLD